MIVLTLYDLKIFISNIFTKLSPVVMPGIQNSGVRILNETVYFYGDWFHF